MTLNIQATPEEVMRAVEAWREFGRANSVHEKAVFALALSLEECASNIVNHSLQRAVGKSFQVSFQRNGDAVMIELRDCGPEFDPTQKLSRHIRDQEDADGGWGILLVRRFTDEMRYRREHGENVLQLVKRLGDPKART